MLKLPLALAAILPTWTQHYSGVGNMGMDDISSSETMFEVPGLWLGPWIRDPI